MDVFSALFCVVNSYIGFKQCLFTAGTEVDQEFFDVCSGEKRGRFSAAMNDTECTASLDHPPSENDTECTASLDHPPSEFVSMQCTDTVNNVLKGRQYTPL